MAIPAIAALAVSTPDIGDPTTIPLIAFLGALVGWTYRRLRERSREQIRRLAEDVAFYSGWLAIAAYTFGLVTGLY